MQYTLNINDKKFLEKCGYPVEDFNQIEEAINVCEYTNENDKQINYQTAIKKLGKEIFLSGISRAAFHWTATRDSEKGKGCVSFDCSKMFK